MKPNTTLARERLNKGGYSQYGQYFGVGAPLYAYQCITWCQRDMRQKVYVGHVRAHSREWAKKAVVDEVMNKGYVRCDCGCRVVKFYR